MNKDLILKITFGISLFCGLIGIYLKITHTYFPVPLIGIGLIAGIIYSGLALMEIFSFKRISQAEKTMWVIGFIFFNPFAGFLYFLQRRNHLTRKRKILSV